VCVCVCVYVCACVCVCICVCVFCGCGRGCLCQFVCGRAWVICHTWMSCVLRVNASCHTYEWVMSHIWMSHVAHIIESCRTQDSCMSQSWHMIVSLYMRQSYMGKSCRQCDRCMHVFNVCCVTWCIHVCSWLDVDNVVHVWVMPRHVVTYMCNNVWVMWLA